MSFPGSDYPNKSISHSRHNDDNCLQIIMQWLQQWRRDHAGTWWHRCHDRCQTWYQVLSASVLLVFGIKKWRLTLWWKTEPHIDMIWYMIDIVTAYTTCHIGAGMVAGTVLVFILLFIESSNMTQIIRKYYSLALHQVRIKSQVKYGI